MSKTCPKLFRLDGSNMISIWLKCSKVYVLYEWAKGQIISKGLLVSSNSPKNEQTISFLLLRRVRSFVFWENSRTPKSPFEIIWPLELCSFSWIFSCFIQDFNNYFLIIQFVFLSASALREQHIQYLDWNATVHWGKG